MSFGLPGLSFKAPSFKVPESAVRFGMATAQSADDDAQTGADAGDTVSFALTPGTKREPFHYEGKVPLDVYSADILREIDEREGEYLELVAVWAMEGVTRSTDPEALAFYRGVIQHLATDPDPIVRVSILRALSRTQKAPSGEMVESLVAMMAVDPEPVVRGAAVMAIQQHLGSTSILTEGHLGHRLLTALATDSEPDIRMAAQVLLSNPLFWVTTRDAETFAFRLMHPWEYPPE